MSIREHRTGKRFVRIKPTYPHRTKGLHKPQAKRQSGVNIKRIVLTREV